MVETAKSKKSLIANELQSNNNFATSRSISARHSFIGQAFKKVRLFWVTEISERLGWNRCKDDFFKIFGGHILFQTVATAAHLGLFNRLHEAGRMTEDEIAQKLKIDLQPCRILLLSLVSARMLVRRKQHYSNSKVAQRFLTDDGEWKFINCLRWQHAINYRAMYHFEEALLTGRNVGLREIPGSEPTLYQRLAHQPMLEKIFQDAMQEISSLSNDFLARYLDFSRTNYLVDVGGGNATNIISLAKHYPNLRASVFDFPTVCEHARANIEAHGLTERLSAEAGNIFSDPLPAGVDCVTYCHFFTIWSLEKNHELLARAFAALPDGGRVIVFNMMQNDGRDGPITSAVGSPYFLTLATGEGMLYSWSDYEDVFKSVGFKKIIRKKLPHDHGVIIGIK